MYITRRATYNHRINMQYNTHWGDPIHAIQYRYIAAVEHHLHSAQSLSDGTFVSLQTYHCTYIHTPTCFSHAYSVIGLCGHVCAAYVRRYPATLSKSWIFY